MGRQDSRDIEEHKELGEVRRPETYMRPPPHESLRPRSRYSVLKRVSGAGCSFSAKGNIKSSSGKRQAETSRDKLVCKKLPSVVHRSVRNPAGYVIRATEGERKPDAEGQA